MHTKPCSEFESCFQKLGSRVMIAEIYLQAFIANCNAEPPAQRTEPLNRERRVIYLQRENDPAVHWPE